MKRPLSAICLAFVLCIAIVASLSKASSFALAQEQIGGITLAGQVQKKDLKNNKISIHLSNIIFLSSYSKEYLSIKTPSQKSSIGCICYLSKESVSPKIGAWVLLKGKAADIKVSTNPGEFNQKKYYENMGIHFCVFDGLVLEQSSQYSLIKEKMFCLRNKIGTIFDLEFDEKYALLLRAMVLGDKENLPTQVKEAYQNCGISHVLAISGLHISIIGCFLYGIFVRLRVKKSLAGILSIVLLVYYGIMVGESASTIRAIIMFSIFIGGRLFKKPYDILTALALAAGILVIINPMNILLTGFQFSFSAILGLQLVKPVLFAMFEKFQHSKVIALLLSGASIMLTSLPIVLWTYAGFAPLSLVANLLVIPTMTILLGCAMLTAFFGSFSCVLAHITRIPCILLLEFYEKICTISNKMPGYFFTLGVPSFAKIIVYYIFLGSIMILHRIGSLRKKRKKRIQILCLVVALSVFFISVHTQVDITVLDVGQGDGIYIQIGANNSLFIDGGSTSKNKVGQYIIEPLIAYFGEKEIDYLFITHFDQDHICGWIEIFKRMKEGNTNLKLTNLVVSKETIFAEGGNELLQLAAENNIHVLLMKEGDKMDFSGASLTCVYPGKRLTDSANENSLVLLLEKDNFSMLFTGDLEGEGEDIVCEKLRKLQVEKQIKEITILKVGHHGSENASKKEFLEQINGRVAIISCGENSYGHPSNKVLERLQESGYQIYITKYGGAIQIETNGKKFKIEPFYNENVVK